MAIERRHSQITCDICVQQRHKKTNQVGPSHGNLHGYYWEVSMFHNRSGGLGSFQTFSL